MTDTASEDVSSTADRLQLAALFADVARSLYEQPTSESTLAAVADMACSTVSGTDCASITSLRAGDLVTVATTEDLLREADRLQQRCGEGPCLESLKEGRTVHIEDLRVSERYPVLNPKLVELGFGSVLAYQLFAGERRLGALNLFASRPNAFDDEALQLGDVFATHAAVALAAAFKEEQLVVAVSTRDLIGQAKGILMERHKIGAEAAFALLVRGSQNAHRKLREVAEEVTRTGVDPHLRR